MGLPPFLFFWERIMVTIKPTEFVIKHAPWSISKAEVAKQCPHRFYLQYIEKKRMNLPPSRALLIGTAVHSALEYALGGNGKLSVNKSFKIALVEHKLTTVEIEEARGLQPSVENFIRKFQAYKKRHDTTPPAIEQKLAIDFDGNPTGFWDKKGLIRGFIDMSVRFNGRPHALIIDHKTGKDHDLKYYEKQFRAYTLFLRATTPELTHIKLGVNFIRADRVEFQKGMVDVRDIEPIFEQVLTFLNDSTAEAHNHKLVRPGPLCDWCDYKSICPAHADGADGKQAT